MKVICNFNDPFKLPTGYPSDFDYGLEVGTEYIVMGIVLYKNYTNLYYLIDTNSRPSWFPDQIFTISDNSLPENWFIYMEPCNADSDINTIFGFNELCNDKEYYDLLVNRNEHALEIYFKNKKIYEKSM